MGESIVLVNNFKVNKVIFNCGEFNSLEKNLIKEINILDEYNRYGHPNKEVLNNLSDSKIYRTDINGNITFNLNNKLKIRKEK